MDQPNNRIFDRIGCGILVFDRYGRLRQINSLAARLLGLPLERLLGRSWEELGLPTRRRDGWPLPAEDLPFNRALTRAEAVNGDELIIERTDGSLLTIAMNASPLFTEGKRMDGAVADFTDISVRVGHEEEARRSRQALQESETRLKALIRHLDEIVFEFTPDGTYLQIWTLEERLLKQPADELIGKRVEEVVGEELGLHIREIFQRVLKTGRAETFEYPLEVLGGSRWFLARIAPIPKVDGRPATLSFFARDITDRKRMEETLRRSDLMKSEFVTTAAHELRTPLTTILGFAELLLNSSGEFSPDQQREFLLEIHAKAEVLTDIVNELLDLSRIEAGRPIPLELGPCNLDDLVAGLVHRYRLRFPGRQFILDLDVKCPPEVLIDRHKMENVLENLLSNAVKYSPEGGRVTISGRLEETAYHLAVTDEGIGMTSEEVERVFDKFFRADTSDTAKPGFGLGMSIARGIVEAHGGRMEVASSPGHGTTVALTLPVRQKEGEPGE